MISKGIGSLVQKLAARSTAAMMSSLATTTQTTPIDGIKFLPVTTRAPTVLHAASTDATTHKVTSTTEDLITLKTGAIFPRKQVTDTIKALNGFHKLDTSELMDLEKPTYLPRAVEIVTARAKKNLEDLTTFMSKVVKPETKIDEKLNEILKYNGLVRDDNKVPEIVEHTTRSSSLALLAGEISLGLVEEKPKAPTAAVHTSSVGRRTLHTSAITRGEYVFLKETTMPLETYTPIAEKLNLLNVPSDPDKINALKLLHDTCLNEISIDPRYGTGPTEFLLDGGLINADGTIPDNVQKVVESVLSMDKKGLPVVNALDSVPGRLLDKRMLSR